MGAPIVEMTPESEREARGQDLRRAPLPTTRTRRRRILIAVALVPGILVALTLTLALVYSVATPPSTPMLARWLTGQPVEREVVPLDAIAPALVQGVFASEDQRFCLHHGVDWEALREVVDDESGPSRGASTITMQTVKNVFLWPGRSYVRKAIEIPLSLLVDAVWGKRRTMEIYLNIAEWGDGVFGAEAAAQRWFRKSAKTLTRNEAAMLVAILPNPIERSPVKPSAETRARASRIRGLMGDMDGLMGCLSAR